MAIHLTPTELADEVNMKRREVISKCMEMGVPIFNGRIDKTLFVSSHAPVHAATSKQAQAAPRPSFAEIAFAGAARRPGTPACSSAVQRRLHKRRRRLRHGDCHCRPAVGDRSRLEDDRRPASARRAQARRQARGHVQGGLGRAGPHGPSPRSARSVEALSLGLIDLGIEKGDKVVDPRQHPPRVDLLRLRGADRRRDRGPDLPDELARGVPVRARELRRQGRDRRGRRAARQDPRRSATAARSSST